MARTLVPLLRMPTGATGGAPWPGRVRKTGVSSTSTWLHSLSGMLAVMTGIPFIGEAAGMLVAAAGVGLIDDADGGAAAAGSWAQPARQRPIAATAAAARIGVWIFMASPLAGWLSVVRGQWSVVRRG